jgi:hypothetical protein
MNPNFHNVLDCAACMGGVVQKSDGLQDRYEMTTAHTNLSIPDVPFPVLLSALIRSRFQAKPATLLIPIDFPFLFAVEELYGTRYQSDSFSLINVGSGFHCLRSFFFFYYCPF